VICEIMNEDGTMARMAELEIFSSEHKLKRLSVMDIITYRLQRESLVELVKDDVLPTEWPGDWKVRVFRSIVDGGEHLAIVCGQPTAEEPVLVRVQHRADTFDVFAKRHSDSMGSLSGAMKAISEAGVGVIVYLDRPVRTGIEMVEHNLGQVSATTQDVNKPRAAIRDLGIGAQILVDSGVGKMRILTNRPRTLVGTDAYGLEVVEQVPIPEV